MDNLSDELKNLSDEDRKKMLEQRENASKDSSADESQSDLGNVNESDPVTEDKKPEHKDPYLESADRIKEITGREGLGRVDQDKGESVTSDMVLGYHSLDISKAPSRGMFYPSDVRFQIRACDVKEIRHFSTMVEEDPFDVSDKLNFILQNCVRISTGSGRRLGWKDIIDDDRLYIIFAIRDLTFVKGENELHIHKPCPNCGHKNDIKLSNDVWAYREPGDTISNYYDPGARAYVVRTKSYGDIRLAPPTLGVVDKITDYIATKERKEETYDKAFMQIMPYLCIPHQMLTEKKIHETEVEMVGWDKKKFPLVYKLVKEITIGVKPNVEVECSECGEEVIARVTFPGGLKGLFLISDISSELL